MTILLFPAIPSTYIYTQGGPLFCLFNTQSFEGMGKAGCLGPQLPPHPIQTAPFTCDLITQSIVCTVPSF